MEEETLEDTGKQSPTTYQRVLILPGQTHVQRNCLSQLFAQKYVILCTLARSL